MKMGYSKWLFATAFLLLLLLALAIAHDTEMGPVLCGDTGNEKGPSRRKAAAVAAIERTCETPSKRFKGPCVKESNCAAVCQTEGFQGGKCRGLRRRCFCTRPCSSS
nr:defensin-like protein [Coffea arabica]